MSIVADSEPLRHLIEAGAVEYLRDQYDKVVVTPAVLEELKSPKETEAVRQWAEQLPSYVEVRVPMYSTGDMLRDRSIGNVDQMREAEKEVLGVIFSNNFQRILLGSKYGVQGFNELQKKGHIGSTVRCVAKELFLRVKEQVQDQEEMRQLYEKQQRRRRR